MPHCRSLLLSHTNFHAAFSHSFCSSSDAPTCGLFTQGLSNEDATALAMLLGTVSLQHDTYLPWWRENTASAIEQPSRSKTAASDENASHTDDDNNDYAGEFCGSDYYQLGRDYHGPHVEDLKPQVAALIAQGKQALKNLHIQDGECAFECATKGKLTPEHFCQAGRMAWDQGMPRHCPWQHTFLMPLEVSVAPVYVSTMLAWHSDPALGSSHDSCLFAVWFALTPMRKRLLRISAGESKLALQLYFQETLKAKLKQPVAVSLKSVNPVSISHRLVVFACSQYPNDL